MWLDFTRSQSLPSLRSPNSFYYMKQEKLEKIIRRAGRNRLLMLNLSDIQLTSLPESIGNFTNLTTLYLDNNQLTCLPESIDNLANLTNLYLNNNSIIDLSILKELSSLRIFTFMRENSPWQNANAISTGEAIHI
jgi:Leucine-rich repeat (LRR) protein